MRLRRFPPIVAGVGALLLVAPHATAAPHTFIVVIDKMAFGSVPAELHKGDAIVWVNRDILKHTATAADKTFDVELPAGAKAKTVLARNGTIPFVCRYHPGMRGTLQVK